MTIEHNLLRSDVEQLEARVKILEDKVKEDLIKECNELAAITPLKDMVFEELWVSFEMISKSLNLPDNVRIVSVSDSDQKTQIKLRFLVPEQFPPGVYFGEKVQLLSDIGDVFRNISDYVRSPYPYGEVRGAE